MRLGFGSKEDRLSATKGAAYFPLYALHRPLDFRNSQVSPQEDGRVAAPVKSFQ